METESRPQKETAWPDPPDKFPPIMTPTEAAQFLRLDHTAHTPDTAKRTLDYWRNKGLLKATKYARHVWYLKNELEAFLQNKTEQ